MTGDGLASLFITSCFAGLIDRDHPEQPELVCHFAGGQVSSPVH